MQEYYSWCAKRKMTEKPWVEFITINDNNMRSQAMINIHSKSFQQDFGHSMLTKLRWKERAFEENEVKWTAHKLCVRFGDSLFNKSLMNCLVNCGGGLITISNPNNLLASEINRSIITSSQFSCILFCLSEYFIFSCRWR